MQFIKTLSKENADMLNPIIEIIDVFRVSQKKLYLSGKGSGIINAKITTVKSGTVIKKYVPHEIACIFVDYNLVSNS